MPLYAEESISAIVAKYTPSQKNVLNSLLGYANVNRYIFPSQKSIADKIGVVLQTCNRALNRFEQDGLIIKEYRHRKTSVYTFNAAFYREHIREYLAEILPSLKYFCAFLFLSVCLLMPECYTINKNINYIRE